MGEESFTYVLSPVTSTQNFAHRVADENLPSLEESMEFTEKMTGTLLIDYDGFIEDLLLGFCRVPNGAHDYRVGVGRGEYAAPAGAILPATIKAVGLDPSSSASSLFQDGAWPFVWAQFERDVTRETLIIDGTPCNDALIALRRIQKLLADAYDELPSRITAAKTHGHRKADECGGLASRFLNTAWGFLGNVQVAYKKMVRNKKLAEAARIAILMAQQTVMAFPVELLHAQFSRSSQGNFKEKDAAESKIVYIGERIASKENDDERSDPPHKEESRRMIVRVERRNHGSRLPYVRVEKFMHVFTLDESANASIKLELCIVIEVSLFTSDQVELNWEWRRPPHTSSGDAAAAPPQPPEEEKQRLNKGEFIHAFTDF
ncbi:hypothetical protein TCSYLVIO_007103 [Trypanosoma cruzi]|nr:hypothetical protein TCSYLVIO_007103 [Trypanosoma cruzi]